MLSDEELEALLTQAGESFAVPEFALELPAPVRKAPLWQRTWAQAGAAAVVLLTGAVLLGSVDGGGAASQADRAVPGVGGSAGEDSGGLDRGTTGAAVGNPPLAVGPQPQSGFTGGQAGTTGGTGAATDSADGARVVKTGEISLLVDEGKVSATVQRLQTLLAGVRGYVASSESDEASEHPSATLAVRVPVGSFEAFVDRVRNLPVKVESASTSGKDVTASYADTQAQIQSLRAARSRYLTILARARTIAETLTVQQRVDEVQQQIDRLEGQRRVLADTSDYGTLTMSVAEKGAGTLHTEEPSGWSKAWDDAKDGFTGGVQRLIAGSGSALLLLLVGVALVLLGRSGYRLARRRMV